MTPYFSSQLWPVSPPCDTDYVSNILVLFKKKLFWIGKWITLKPRIRGLFPPEQIDPFVFFFLSNLMI